MLCKSIDWFLYDNGLRHERVNGVSAKVCHSIGIIHRTRYIRKKFLRKHFYFSFYTLSLKLRKYSMGQYKKSNLQALYQHQKHTAIINFKVKFTSAKPLLEQINAVPVHEMNFMHLCKSGNTSSILKLIYTLKPFNKYTTRSKKVLLKPLYKKSFAKFKLRYCGPHLRNKIIAPNNDPL